MLVEVDAYVAKRLMLRNGMACIEATIQCRVERNRALDRVSKLNALAAFLAIGKIQEIELLAQRAHDDFLVAEVGSECRRCLAELFHLLGRPFHIDRLTSPSRASAPLAAHCSPEHPVLNNLAGHPFHLAAIGARIAVMAATEGEDAWHSVIGVDEIVKHPTRCRVEQFHLIGQVINAGKSGVGEHHLVNPGGCHTVAVV